MAQSAAVTRKLVAGCAREVIAVGTGREVADEVWPDALACFAVGKQVVSVERDSRARIVQGRLICVRAVSPDGRTVFVSPWR